METNIKKKMLTETRVVENDKKLQKTNLYQQATSVY